MNAKQKEDITAMRKRGLTYAKIAEAVGLPLNSVKSYCYRNATAVDLRPRCRCCGKVINIREKCKPRQFCSDKCRVAYWRKNHKNRTIYSGICVYCGNVFQSKGNKSQKYCSHSCYITARFGESQVAHEQ